MADYKKYNRSGGRSNHSFGSSRVGNRDFKQSERYDAECSSCHKMCQVPFRPNGKKPVYCSDCYQRDDDRPARSDDRKPARPDMHASDRRIDGLARKLESLQEAVERLTLALENMNRAAALTRVVREHAPAKAGVKAPKKTTKRVKKPAKV